MDELTVAQVNTHMAEGASHGVEKHQVAGFEFVTVDGLGGFGLFVCATWQHQTNGLLVHVAHKSAAIETGILIGTATAVRHAQETHGLDHQIGGSAAHELARLYELIAQLGSKAFLQGLTVQFVVARGSRRGKTGPNHH